MRNLRESWAVAAVLGIVIAASAAGMRPDLAASRVDLNDNVSHFALIARVVDTVEHRGNPLDAWSPEWTCGFPMLRVYQTLTHLMVAAVYFALGKSVALMTVFVWARFLAVVLFPLSFDAAARLFELSRPAALAGAAVAPLIASSGLYGLEYGSYVWAGNGLFPQSVAAHLFLLCTEVIELGQLKQRFYTPGLLARVLKGERLPDVEHSNPQALPGAGRTGTRIGQHPSPGLPDQS